MKNKDERNITDLTDKCTNCGNCRTVCPVFDVKKEEIYCTRGRINLIKGLYHNELKPGSELKNKLYACLNCKQCTDNCPADVKYEIIIKRAKAKILAESKFFSLKKFMITKLFSKDPLTAAISFFILKNFLNLMNKKGFHLIKKLIFGFLRTDKNAVFNIIPQKTFFGMGKRNMTGKDQKDLKIGLFIGCGGKYLYPETADKFVKIIRSHGIKVQIPKDQVCCGSPLEYEGLIKESSKNALQNYKAFNSLINVDFITSLCSNASIIFESLKTSNKEGFRQQFKKWTSLIIENNIPVKPLYKNSIVFHSCPKCGSKDIFIDFINILYRAEPFSPELINDFCGAVELFNRTNPDIRDRVTGSFCKRFYLHKFDYIACSSFECIEYLNGYFKKSGMTSKAIHFIDAVDT